MAGPSPPAHVTGALLAAGDENLFAAARRFKSIALAVSGGTDSLALLHLFARWIAAVGDVAPPLVLTVDHGSRKEAADEARFVASEAAALGLRHETLVWAGPKPVTGFPEKARQARYALLAGRLAQEPLTPRALITAHTLDDQAETVLMRLARGSGVRGLSGMRLERLLPGSDDITVLRPLLGVTRAQLSATLVALGRAPVDDPTNRDLRFERPQWRAAAQVRQAAGLSDQALGLSAHRLQRADEALEAATDGLWRAAVCDHDGLWSAVDRALLMEAAAELRIRLLERVLAASGGSHPRPQLAEIEHLAGRIPDPAWNGATLGGCLIKPRGAMIGVFREPGRAGMPDIELRPGEAAIWDGRFTARLGGTAPQACQVRALDQREAAVLRRALPIASACPLRALLTVPAFFAGGALVAVPTLGPWPPERAAGSAQPAAVAALDGLVAPSPVRAVLAPACSVQRLAVREIAAN